MPTYILTGEHPGKWHSGLYRNAFGCLWDFINFKRGFGWLMNPWVWKLVFEHLCQMGGCVVDV